MAKSLLLALVVFVPMLPGLAIVEGQNDFQKETKQIVLWASVCVSQPIFYAGGVATLQMSFGVVNDGSSTVNPKIGASHLSINGIEPKDWPFIINNGIRSLEHEALPPGHFLLFSYMLGDRYFAKPGIYTVRWWGDDFKAQPITFRVLPDKR